MKDDREELDLFDASRPDLEVEVQNARSMIGRLGPNRWSAKAGSTTGGGDAYG